MILSDEEITELCQDSISSSLFATSRKKAQDKFGSDCVESRRALMNGETPMIFPFVDKQVRTLTAKGKIPTDRQKGARKIISFGLSSYGYDVRCARKFAVFSNLRATVIDPKNFDAECLSEVEADFCVIPPNSYALTHTVETFSMPNNVLALCVGKSTYARAGVGINVTPIEPGFRGQVVIEISNLSPLPVKIWANEGIAQFIFYRGKPCVTPYGMRSGKYQNQLGITLAKV